MENYLDKQVLLVLCDEDEGNKDFLKGFKDISPDVKVISEESCQNYERNVICQIADLATF